MDASELAISEPEDFRRPGDLIDQSSDVEMVAPIAEIASEEEGMHLEEAEGEEIVYEAEGMVEEGEEE